MDNPYTRAFSLVERECISETAIKRNPEKAPVIILHGNNYYKYLLPYKMSVVYMISIFRRRINLRASEGIFVLTNDGKLLTGNTTIREIYFNHKNTDGFLYLHIRKESMFGLKKL